MKKSIFFLLIVNISVFAQWNQIGQSLNAEISSLVKSNNILFATTTTAGVFSTSDEASWVASNSGLTDLAVNDIAESNGTLAAGTKNGGVYVSTDNGNSWQQKSNGLTIPFQALPNTNTIVYSGQNMIEGGGYGIFTSTDYGENWARTFPSTYGVRGLYKGSNYTYVGVGPSVYRSSDDGLNWNFVVTANTTIKKFVTFPLAVGQDKIFVGTLDGIFYSENNGSSWIEKKISNKNINDMAAYGNNIFVVSEPFMTNDAGFIYVSTDFGNNWNDITANISSVAANHVRKILIDGDYIYAGTSLGNVYKRKLSDVVTTIEKSNNTIPTEFLLDQNYPNPFNPSTTISFLIPQVMVRQAQHDNADVIPIRQLTESRDEVHVTLKVYDVLGREVATLVNENLSAGSYSYNFDASKLTSGVYLYKLQAGKYSEMKKMILLR
jgi:photosystem II stability/assembly factor-like uncharacterized protein